MVRMLGLTAAVVGMLVWGVGVQAEVVMETVIVGNPGNVADTRYDPTGYGSVVYTYNIGKYEVTAGQYRDFLNAVDPTGANPYGLYNNYMDSSPYGCQITWNAGTSTYDFSGAPSGTEADWADRPVNYVSWYDTLRFANWMHNGQGSGDTEDGAYDMSLGSSVVRNPGATWFLPTEDEWYKVAYHKNDGVTGNYFDYPTSSDGVPGYVNDSGNLSGTGTAFTGGGTDPGNYATYDGDAGTSGIGSPYYRTEVGEWENSDSPYGTFDQGGNVWEWNETLIGSYLRGIRGGSFSNAGNYLPAANSIYYHTPTDEPRNFGFRVAQVPEPATLSLLLLSGLMLRRRR